MQALDATDVALRVQEAADPDRCFGQRFSAWPKAANAGSYAEASPPGIAAKAAGPFAGGMCHVIDGSSHMPDIEDPASYAATLKPFPKEHAYVRAI